MTWPERWGLVPQPVILPAVRSAVACVRSPAWRCHERWPGCAASAPGARRR